MKITKETVLPQLESGPRIGGIKKQFQRSNFVMLPITMLSAMVAAYSTTPQLRQIFSSFWVFMLFVVLGVGLWMIFDFILLYPSEQAYTQFQHHRRERSPLKQDTEDILELLDELEENVRESSSD